MARLVRSFASVQGALELAQVAYVGSGVLGSANGMDKEFMKRLFRDAGIPSCKWAKVDRSAWESGDKHRIAAQILFDLGSPIFVKPANLGSSVGVTKASDVEAAILSIDTAAAYDRKVIVEEAVDAREIEVSVLGNDRPEASLAGEIVPDRDFYDYDSKYSKSATSKLLIPAPLRDETMREIRELAVKAFQAVGAEGLARVDFFVDRRSGRVLLNEINTMPGFTSISMYPKLWEATGVAYADLCGRLIALAEERHRDRMRNRIS